MRMLNVILGSTAAIAISMSTAAFAMGGGNGQGGSGGGDAHSAATAGMTYRGDPITSPMAMMPGSPSSRMDSSDADMRAMPAASNDSTTPQHTPQ